MADGDNLGQALVNSVSPSQQMAQNAEAAGAMQGSSDQIQAQQAEEGSTTSKTPTQRQAPKMGGQPLLYRYISEMIKGQAGGQPISRGDASLNFLGEFLGNLSQGLASAGHGPGANLRGAAGAIQAPYQRSLQDFQVQQQANQQQAQLESEQARTALTEQQTKQMQQMVTLPNGMTMPYSLAKTIYPQLIRTQGAERNVDVRTASNEKIAGEKIASQEGMQDKAIASKEGLAQKSLAEKQDEFKQTQGYKVWKEKLDKQTQLQVANLTQNKAPAAMLQAAGYASGGLTMMADADAAMQRLEAKGVMGGVGKNKVEDWIFGKGLVDPTLDAETRNDIGKLRAALGYTSSAAMRAHTGRASQDIYKDFKDRLGPGQDWNALRGAMDETENLLGHYTELGSNQSIQQLRSGNLPLPQTQRQGQTPKRPPNVPDKAVFDPTTRRWRMP